MNKHQLLLLTLLALGFFGCDSQRRIDLEDTNWQLVKMTVLGGFEFVPDEPERYVLNFRSDSRLQGTSDCNNLTGSWQQEETSLSFQSFTSSTNLCPPGSLHNYLVLYLRDVVGLEFREGNLILSTTTEDVALEFESRDKPQ